MSTALQEPPRAFCRRHHIRKLSLYGSVLRDDFRPDSDVDVLVELEPGYAVGFRIVDIEEELGDLLGGRRVDLVAEKYRNADHGSAAGIVQRAALQERLDAIAEGQGRPRGILQSNSDQRLSKRNQDYQTE